MVDYFKIAGHLYPYNLDQYCRHTGIRHFKSGGTAIYYEIPNRDHSEALKFSFLQRDPHKVWIEGNLRKWWLRTGHAVADLTSNDIIEAMLFLADRLGTDVMNLFSLKIRRVELGGNILLPKEAEVIFQSAMEYPQLKRVPYGEDTVYFKGSKYHIILYDKLKEMVARGAITKSVGKKLRDRIFILRFEISIKRPSGYRLKPYIEDLGTIVNHFDELVEEWLNAFYRIEYVNPVASTKDLNKIHWTKKKFQNYLVYMELERSGLESAIILSDRLLSNRRADSRRDLRRIVNEFRSNENSTILQTIGVKVADKAHRLKRI